MYKNIMANATTRKVTVWLVVFALALITQAAMAQGLDKVNVFLENIETLLHGIAITVVTIAIMWAGYKFLFKHAGAEEVGRILAGGLLIGGAAEIAAWLLS
jgi:type IV secretory pathway VirB2 component (pilin)